MFVVKLASICDEGKLVQQQSLGFSSLTGIIRSSSLDATISSTDDGSTAHEADEAVSMIELEDGDIIAPGLIELQTNGLSGVHFTSLTKDTFESDLERVSQEMAKNGVTGWYATVPTVEETQWKEILPFFRPKSFTHINGSPLLGAHVEGPYLHASKKGAHNEAYFKTPAAHSYQDIYGEDNLRDVIRYITIAPELDGALDMIQDLRRSFPSVIISVGHSTASYDIGVQSIQAGARSLTHIFNAMNPLHHRDPGLAGTIGMPLASSTTQQKSIAFVDAASLPQRQDEPQHSLSPYFTMIPDLVHLHPAVMRMCYLSNPSKCVLITDSIELAGLADGIYPPNGQITYAQRKKGNRATNVADLSKGEKETLIGSCITLPEGVKNMSAATGVSFAEAIRCASTNVADLMNDSSRGRLVTGKRADFVVFDGMGQVKQTWIGGRKVYERP